MEFLDFEEVSFHPDANVGHLCNSLNNTIGLGIWYDNFKFKIQNGCG
jgi:hypothetical protein